ncbi:MAG TPA: hypothetical protein VII94_04155 [Candidatus Saccharimonadales bacterium]
MNCILCDKILELQMIDNKLSAYYSCFCTTKGCCFIAFSDEPPYDAISEYNLDIFINGVVYYISCYDGKYDNSEPRMEIQKNTITFLSTNIWVPPNEILTYFERIIKLKAFL